MLIGLKGVLLPVRQQTQLLGHRIQLIAGIGHHVAGLLPGPGLTALGLEQVIDVDDHSVTLHVHQSSTPCPTKQFGFSHCQDLALWLPPVKPRTTQSSPLARASNLTQ